MKNLDGSYSVIDIRNYFQYIIENMKHLLINHQSKYLSTKIRIKLHSRLKPRTTLKFLNCDCAATKNY